jgi:hypothetical protein
VSHYLNGFVNVVIKSLCGHFDTTCPYVEQHAGKSRLGGVVVIVCATGPKAKCIYQNRKYSVLFCVNIYLKLNVPHTNK